MSGYVTGSEVRVGDVIDYGRDGWIVVRFAAYDSPLIPVTGPGRIAVNPSGDGFAVYDNHPVRMRYVNERAA